MPRVRLLLVSSLLAATVAVPTAHARTHVAVAIGDQSPAMFTQAKFKALKIKKARYFMAWDAAKHRNQLAAADAYITAAKAAHVRVLLHISTNNYAHYRAKLPSVAAYKKYVGKLVRRYRQRGVKEWGVWNEANHISEPTWKSPKRAAQYFHVMRGLCHRCTIVALDLLDQTGTRKYSTKAYIARFFAALNGTDRAHATIFGIHNYADTNRHRSSGTRRILAAVRSQRRGAKFWFTETGGLVSLGRSFRCSTSRASRAIGFMFTLARTFRSDVSRLYVYSWFGTRPRCGAFDAGLVEASGKPRKGYYTLKKQARSFDR
jgi:hypothetical protein